MVPRSGGSLDVMAGRPDSLASETASSSTVGRGGGRPRGPRLGLRTRGGMAYSVGLSKDGELVEADWGVELYDR